MESTVSPAPALPEDVLEDILGHLMARSLATSRQVCKAWRDVVDSRRLLLWLRRLLPHSLCGLFVNYHDHRRVHFFSRPTPAVAPGPRIDPEFSFIEPEQHFGPLRKVADHCNGLVLYRSDHYKSHLYVCNPATQRWVHLPLLSVESMYSRRAFLVFNPAVSRHYEVLVSPLEPEKKRQGSLAHADTEWPPADDTEWPPSRWTWHVFSSRTGRWREKVFVREGEAAGIAVDMVMDFVRFIKTRWRHAVYWRGVLYVHCRGEYVSRLSLSDGKYRVIRSPIDRAECNKNESFIGRSKKGVYFAAIYRRQLRVWILNECPDQTEWILKHDRVLKPDDWWGVVCLDGYYQVQCNGPWILDDYYDNGKRGRNVDWSSDDDDIIHTVDWEENDNEEFMYPESFHFLGFHPYKEVIFLTTLHVAVAYHLNTWKVQFLGILKPGDYTNCGVHDSFVYTPCYALRDRGVASADFHGMGQASSSCS